VFHLAVSRQAKYFSNQVMSPMVEDIGGSEACMDDIVVWGKKKKKKKKTHDMRLKQVMDSVTHKVYHKHAHGL